MQNGPALIDGASRGASGRRFFPRMVPDQRGDGPGVMCDVHLDLPARADHVVLVRHVVGALAEAIRLPAQRIEDIKLAVTEACTNVVRHAYAREPGRMGVVATAAEGGLEVVVSDDGDGIRPHAHTGSPGLGLPLMAAVAHEFEIDQTRSAGTRVRMSFPAAE